ncbi:MAG: hypothetical protein AB2A00_33430 [Myxococcota bacterium]
MSEPHQAHLEALEKLCRMLARIYAVEEPPAVTPFLVDEDGLQALASCGAITPRTGAREEVFVLDDGHEVSLAVYLDERARQAVSDCVRDDGLALSTEQFGDFCVALEGVSHFLLMSHRAQAEQPVTELELELQAEVDKYVVARLSPWVHAITLTAEGEEPRASVSLVDARAAPDPGELQRVLFQSYALAEHLRTEQVERYVTASRLAQRYCRRLERDYLHSRRHSRALADLCAFYRKSQVGRLHHIGW